MIRLQSCEVPFISIPIIFFMILCLIVSGCGGGKTTDTTPEKPTDPRITINGGEATTLSQTVQLILSCKDDKGIVEMKISNNPDLSGASWEPYATSKTWTLSEGFGTKTVYVLYVDIDDNFSDVTSASIEYIDPATLPSNPSIIINNGDTATGSQTVELTLNCEDDKGIVEMKISGNSDLSGASWEPYTESTTWTLSEGFGKKTVYIQFRDADNNVSEIVSDSIEYAEKATIKMTPSDSTVAVGKTVNIEVIARGAVRFLSARITISFDPALVEVTKIRTEGEGFLLTDAGADVIISEENMYDNKAGKLVFGILGQKSGFTGATGDGVLACITFRGKSAGNSPLLFVDTDSEDFVVYRYADNEKGFELYDVFRFDGSITVYEEGKQ